MIRELDRRAAQRRRSDPAADRETELHRFKVLSFAQWCALNGISPATGRRLIKAGKAPRFIRLSDRRIGVTVGDNAAWQQANQD